MSRFNFHKWWSYALILAILLLLMLTGGATALVSRASSIEGPQIHLQYASFDPLIAEPQIPALGRSQVEAGGQASFLIQFSGPVQESWKIALEENGARLYGYVPDYAFIARVDAANLDGLTKLPYVRWIGPYHPVYRVAEPLFNISSTEGERTLNLSVQTLPDADWSALYTQIEALGGSVQAQATNSVAGYLQVTIPSTQVNGLAALHGVLWVEPYLEPQLHNDVGGGTIMRADNVHTNLNLFGNGQIVGVADSGLDTGDLVGLHSDVNGRVLSAYCLGRPSPCDWSDYVSHGTHVVGSVLGNGAASGSIPATHQYEGTYAGVAPEAQLVFQSIADATGGLGGIPFDRGKLMRDAYLDGARIHTNSWGAPSAGVYTSQSEQVDEAMWDNKDMLVLFSAGNSGEDADKDGLIDSDSIGSPGTAKNVLTVGASENNRPTIYTPWGSGYGEPIASDYRADSPSGMAAFSSRGPTDDGRIKPDVVAPGTFIASTRTRQYVFEDDVEGDTSAYATGTLNGGTGNSWQLLTDDPNSPTHYWKETVIGNSFNNGAMTVLLTPPMDVRPTGGYFDVHFWHKYNLSPGDSLVVGFLNPNTSLFEYNILSASGSRSSYTLSSTTLKLPSTSPPSSVQIGFAIRSDGSSNSTWWLDDIRVDGADWGTMSSVGLANPGDIIDESYLMMGGTSMSTPLTAGAAALVREWLVDDRGITNPSGALMKGVLINGAADMAPGQYTTPQEVPFLRPNPVIGWGRVDLKTSLSPNAPRQVWLQDVSAGLSTGGSSTYSLTVGWAISTTMESANLGWAEGAVAVNASSSLESYGSVSLSQVPGTPEPTQRTSIKSPDSRRVELKADNLPSNIPSIPEGAVSLILDDGNHEALHGVGDFDNDLGYQFIWLNRFTPNPADFPFDLEEIQVLFDNYFGNISVGDAVELVVYQDADGDPSNGATLLGTVNETIQAVDGIAWSIYTLSSPITISGPGDVLIGVINRFVDDGVSPLSYPAAMDTSSSLDRSWMGYWDTAPPNPPNLPANSYFEVIGGIDGGNWLIRGSGTTGGSATPTPIPTPPPGGGSLRITLTWTDFPGSQAAAKALVNDLDLEVIDPDGVHYYGNGGVYSTIQCLRDGTWDSCNNVEGILVPNAPQGEYTVIVHAPNIPMGPQPFAIVATGDNLLGTAQPVSYLYLPFATR